MRLASLVHIAYPDGTATEGHHGATSTRKRSDFVILYRSTGIGALDLARAHDASIAWVLRQALDRYLETQGAVAKDTHGHNRSGVLTRA